MNGWLSLLVAALAMPLLAGCAQEVPGPPLAALPPEALEAGGFYAFRHGGGDLALAMDGDGSAELVLFGADDARLGHIGLGGQSSGRFVLDGVASGELVAQVLAVNGTLAVRSGGALVEAFERLPAHVERHVLVQEPLGPLSFVGVPGLDPHPADAQVDLRLLRTPSALRLLVQGSFQDLDVRLAGSGGTVLEAHHPGGPIQPVVGPFALSEVPSEPHDENVRDGAVAGRVTASHFEGVLLLEAESFSRAKPPAADGAVTQDVPRFTYGALPDQPVSFHVRAGTAQVYVFQEGSRAQDACGDAVDEAADEEAQACSGPEALVALFGPHDERVATVRVPANQTIAVPVHADGEWVAVLLQGQATLGADRVPADFELHPLDVRSVTAPAGPASGTNGEYGQAAEEVQADGVAFRVHATDDLPQGMVGEPFLLGPAQCGPPTLVARQGGETIGSWGFQPDPDPDGRPAGLGDDGEASRLLDGLALTLVHDDFGPDCQRLALVVDGYVR